MELDIGELQDPANGHEHHDPAIRMAQLAAADMDAADLAGLESLVLGLGLLSREAADAVLETAKQGPAVVAGEGFPQSAINRRRGRPTDSQLKVAEKLLLTFEQCLARKSFDELTIREVAAMSGFSPSTVSYYFGNKDGLFIALIDNMQRKFVSRLSNFKKRLDTYSGNPTHEFIAILMSNIDLNIGLFKSLSIEMIKRNSPVREHVINTHFPSVSRAILGIVRKLIKSGVYAKGLNAQYSAHALGIFATHRLSSDLLHLNPQEGEFSNSAWYDYIGDLLHSKFTRG